MSIPIPQVSLNAAFVAGIFSLCDVPPPAKVVIIPLVSIFLTRLLWKSAMKILFQSSAHNRLGKANLASIAGPPSPNPLPVYFSHHMV